MKRKRILLIYVISAVFIILTAAVVTAVIIYSNIVTKSEALKQYVFETLIRWEDHKKELEEARLEIIKLQEEQKVKEIIDFYENYKELREEYYEDVLLYEVDKMEKAASIDELKNDVKNRLNSARYFKERLESTDNIPEPLLNFYNLNIDYLNNEIQIMYSIIAYYGGFNYSTYDDTELIELIMENERLLLEIDEELNRVFKEYEIEYLL